MLSKGYSNHDRLRDYASLFSRNQVLSWLRNDFSSIDAKILRYDWKILENKNWTYLKYLKIIYKKVEKEYQNEYIIKNSIINQWLKDELGQYNSTIFNEYRVGNAIADMVMFNGVSKAFEIKTRFDSDTRLSHQLENYRKAFNQVYIIVPISKLNSYINVENDIGIVAYEKYVRDKFNLIRKAKNRSSIEPKVIMDILHTKEYKSIVKTYYGQLPQMTSFNQYEICYRLINQIPISTLNDLYLMAMKLRRSKNYISFKIHKEFNQLSLALNFSKKQYVNLMCNLKQNINIE